MSFTVPDSYRAQLGAAELAERSPWLATVPTLARRYASRWSLTLDGPALHGYVAVVWPVRTRDGTPAMLKISWPDVESRDEALALATWAGDGTVRLLDHDGPVLLLERLDAHRSLNEEPIDVAVDTVARLLRRSAVPAPQGLHRHVRDEAARPHADGPIPKRIADACRAACRDLGPTAGNLLVNEDLHYFNVLRGGREPWLVIDPKPIAGDPEYAVIPMLWNRYAETGGAQGIRARFDRIADVAGLDRERARGWTLIRAVANWRWAAGGGAGGGMLETLTEIAAAMAC